MAPGGRQDRTCVSTACPLHKVGGAQQVPRRLSKEGLGEGHIIFGHNNMSSQVSFRTFFEYDRIPTMKMFP
jgi:hypothetical protein